MTHALSRRRLLATAGAAATALLVAPGSPAAGRSAPAAAPGAPAPGGPGNPARPFTPCLNTATLRGYKLPLTDEIDLCAKAGFAAVEPWLDEVSRYAKSGGDVKALAKRIADAGLSVPSVIAFPNWLIDDDAKRVAGLEQAKRDFDLVAAIGGERMAAPAVGEAPSTASDLPKVAGRYRALLDVGQNAGVVPHLEMWGHSKTTGRLANALFIVLESGHAKACILPDVFHVYKAGQDFAAFRYVGPAALHVFHMNDYPADPPRERANDGNRVFPGDGIAPLPALLRDLRLGGIRCALSIELFNKEYWKQDALAVLRAGREKLQAVIDKASSL